MMTLRFARPEDAEALLEVYRPYVTETAISFETAVPSPEEFRRRIEEISAFYPYLVAEEDGRILGYAYAHAFGERRAYRFTVETSIYIDRSARGAGVGTALYRALFSLLRAQGMHAACAVITCPNDASFSFHRAMGFRDGGVLPDFSNKLGAWYGVAYLHLPLLPASPDPAEPCSVHALSPQTVERCLSESRGNS